MFLLASMDDFCFRIPGMVLTGWHDVKELILANNPAINYQEELLRIVE